MNISILTLVGFVLPPFIDLINSKVASSNLRYIISTVICLVVGVVTNLDKLSSWSDIVANSALIFAEAQSTHKLYYADSGLRTSIQKTLN